MSLSVARTDPVAFPAARYSCRVFIRTLSRMARFSSVMPASPPISSWSLHRERHRAHKVIHTKTHTHTTYLLCKSKSSYPNISSPKASSSSCSSSSPSSNSSRSESSYKMQRRTQDSLPTSLSGTASLSRTASLHDSLPIKDSP